MDRLVFTRDDGKALSVTQLLRRMKLVLETQVGEVWVEGEVSNLRKQSSGHWYFTLKDDAAQISCAMFGAKRREGAEVLADGTKVRVFAEATVYESRGQLQVVVTKAERAGAGDLQARFEALKRKLESEGLFDAARKQPIPRFPSTVGIITSGTGAAIQDILQVIARRAPWVQPVLYPVRVQGRGAELDIARAIREMGAPEAHGFPRCDVIIVGRGGGSIEDLWNFNEEVVARAIADCPIPVISAVGHETDFTIADFVADLRAPTPSAAAELAVADGAALHGRLRELGLRLLRPVKERMQADGSSLAALRRGVLGRDASKLLIEFVMRTDSLASRLAVATRASLDTARSQWSDARQRHRMHHPSFVIERRFAHLAAVEHRLTTATKSPVQRLNDRLVRLASMLRALGPESAFQRGFSITLDADGRAVTSADTLKPGDTVRTRFAKGEAESVVARVIGK
jgi:exodeoxyribonuclease VII large subunit